MAQLNLSKFENLRQFLFPSNNPYLKEIAVILYVIDTAIKTKTPAIIDENFLDLKELLGFFEDCPNEEVSTDLTLTKSDQSTITLSAAAAEARRELIQYQSLKEKFGLMNLVYETLQPFMDNKDINDILVIINEKTPEEYKESIEHMRRTLRDIEANKSNDTITVEIIGVLGEPETITLGQAAHRALLGLAEIAPINELAPNKHGLLCPLDPIDLEIIPEEYRIATSSGRHYNAQSLARWHASREERGTADQYDKILLDPCTNTRFSVRDRTHIMPRIAGILERLEREEQEQRLALFQQQPSSSFGLFAILGVARAPIPTFGTPHPTPATPPDERMRAAEALLPQEDTESTGEDSPQFSPH